MTRSVLLWKMHARTITADATNWPEIYAPIAILATKWLSHFFLLKSHQKNLSLSDEKRRKFRLLLLRGHSFNRYKSWDKRSQSRRYPCRKINQPHITPYLGLCNLQMASGRFVTINGRLQLVQPFINFPRIVWFDGTFHTCLTTLKERRIG